jgi:uncharacterized repeat protein (TIGR03806 family)
VRSLLPSNGHRPRSSAETALTVTIAIALIAAAPPDNNRRIPWTTSHFAGTPDPPLPYTAERAFPKLVFNRPVLLAQAPGGRHLVVGQVGGQVLSFPADPGVDHAELSLDLAASRRTFGRLYGLAFHPRFVENRQVFLCYTLRGDTAEGTRVSRFAARGVDPLVIDADSEEVILTYRSGGHNGGCLAFGPEGFLYISTGDATAPSPPDVLETGQDLSDLLSSILRIDVDRRDAGRAYRVPPDNPFVHLAGARPEIWAYGLRNPWRMSFDRATGDLWVGDVGWEQWELIFRVERGANCGWSVREGRQTVRPGGRLGPTPITPPVVDHPHSEAASMTGGYVYHGSRLGELAGTYVYGDYQSGKVWGLKHDGRQVTWRGALADTGLRLVSFGEDGAGELYLVDYEGTNQIYRLVPNRGARTSREFPRTLSRTGLFASTSDHAPAPGVLPYSINAEMWADGARAERFLAIPGNGRIEVGPRGVWTLPEGSVLARTVSLDVSGGKPGEAPRPRRVETQVLHREGGSWRPYTYVWDDEQSDAVLAGAEGAVRTLPTAGGRALTYRVAPRAECVLCHNPWVEAGTTVFGVQSASPLALNAAQLDRDVAGGDGNENPLRRLERLGDFAVPPPAASRLADPYDERADLDARARAYLQVNCAQCHAYNAGGSATIALGAGLDLAATRTIDARPLQGTFGIDDARIIAPGEPERSVLYYRIAKMGAGRMPRIGSHRVDGRATRLIADWIASLGEARAPAPSGALGRRPTSTREALGLVRRIDRGDVPAAELRRIVDATRDCPQVEIRDLFERFVPEAERVERLGDAIDPAAILALAGDAGRGRAWFFSESATQCKSCHRIGGAGAGAGAGVAPGPDLDAIGSKYGKPELLRHILAPAQTVEPRYALQAVATHDGRVHEGLLVEKTPEALVLRDARGQEVRIAANDVAQQATRPGSLMPEGLLRDLTAQQAADLVEYLASLKAKP